MNTDPRTGMAILNEDACWELLASAEVARLAVVVGDDLEIFPINFVLDGRTIVFQTGEGTKLAAITVAHRVVLEADGYDLARNRAWSVVVRGEAGRVEDFEEIYRVEALPLRPWTGHPKQWFVHVRPTSVSGRGFTIAAPVADR
jgi:nitroimidazol reductase NimA-like FMN-containing flavoprotein (pyridoxamine 5'-phosphate oxidase superfamily)